MTYLTIIQICQVKDTDLSMWSSRISQNQDQKKVLKQSCGEEFNSELSDVQAFESREKKNRLYPRIIGMILSR